MSEVRDRIDLGAAITSHGADALFVCSRRLRARRCRATVRYDGCDEEEQELQYAYFHGVEISILSQIYSPDFKVKRIPGLVHAKPDRPSDHSSKPARLPRQR